MKIPNLSSLDQDEMLALTDRLRLHSANCRALVLSQNGEMITAPQLSGDVIENLEILVNHATALEAKLGDKSPRFDAASSSAGSNAKKPTLTEMCLAQSTELSDRRTGRK
jgi:hypothetical protein